jgi:hypothetical protein
MLLQHAAGVVEHRKSVYGAARPLFEHIACRWSLVLGMEVTPAQVALCLIDLKLARLARDPSHLDSIVDVAGYAACLARSPVRSEVRGALERHLPRSLPTEDELFAMRRAAWRKQGIAVLRPDDIRDKWVRQTIVNEATRLYGRREMAR